MRVPFRPSDMLRDVLIAGENKPGSSAKMIPQKIDYRRSCNWISFLVQVSFHFAEHRAERGKESSLVRIRQ